MTIEERVKDTARQMFCGYSEDMVISILKRALAAQIEDCARIVGNWYIVGDWQWKEIRGEDQVDLKASMEKLASEIRALATPAPDPVESDLSQGEMH